LPLPIRPPGLDPGRQPGYGRRVLAPPKTSVASPQRKVGLALDPHQLALRAVELAQSKQAEDVVLMDLRAVTNIAAYFVVCTAHSDPQLRAVADAVIEGLAAQKQKVWHAEGYGQNSWVLLDYVDVVVHVFLPDTRQYYTLERLWGDAPIERFPD